MTPERLAHAMFTRRCELDGGEPALVDLPLIVQRIQRRRDPVEAVKNSGEDGGLFDLLDGGAA